MANEMTDGEKIGLLTEEVRVLRERMAKAARLLDAGQADGWCESDGGASYEMLSEAADAARVVLGDEP